MDLSEVYSHQHYPPQRFKNPLLVPKVFNQLVRYLSVEDLKACRLVTRVWHSEATDLLSQRIQGILLHEKVEWKKFLKLLSKTSSTKLTNLDHCHPFHSFTFFSTYPEDPSATPYKTAILDYMHSKYRLPRRTLWDEMFFSTYGIQIHELKYIQFNFNSEKSLREFREMLSTNCPNLTCLTLQFQKDVFRATPTPSPTPSPSPSPLASSGTENVFFPPNEESQRKTLASLKKFTISTDNKSYMNPHALEELMFLMPSLEEFTYRYKGAKKQWTLVRKIDIIDVLCSVINAGHYKKLRSLDLDSHGTVLSGEDFKKISKLNLGGPEPKLKKFCCQVFIKNDLDWDRLCAWLVRIHASLVTIDIQVRTYCPQQLSEQELPLNFPNVRRARLLLDNNLNIFLKRLPKVEHFSGVYDNEFFPFQSAMEELNLGDDDGDNGGTVSRSQQERPSCPSAKYLRIHGNEEFMLNIEWKSEVFFNINSFETDVYFDQDLRFIWVHMQRIKTLILHLRCQIPEQAFTGAGVLPITAFDDNHPVDYHDFDHLEMLEEYPHIGLMKNLETLEIYTGSRQDAFGTHFSASIIIYGVSLLSNLKRLVLPPAIPSKCLENSIRYLAELKNLVYLSICDDTFKSVLPFHGLKMDLPNLEIVVRYYQIEIKRMTGNAWKLERLEFPDFLPEHRRRSIHKRHSAP